MSTWDVSRAQYHHGDLRRALIEAALELIAETGPEGFNLREVARRAGVSPAAPYRHFTDKADLLAAVAAEGIRKLREAIRTAHESAGDDFAAKFQSEGVTYVEWAVEHPSSFRVFNLPEQVSGQAGAALLEENENMVAALTRAQSQGLLAEGNPEVMALAAQALVYGLARMFVDGHLRRAGVGMERASEVATAVTSMLGSGLAPR